MVRRSKNAQIYLRGRRGIVKMKFKWSTLFLVLFVATSLVLASMGILLDLAEMNAKDACKGAGHDGWVQVGGEGYCWKATESLPVLVEDVQ